MTSYDISEFSHLYFSELSAVLNCVYVAIGVGVVMWLVSR